MRELEIKNAKIISTFLGREDHGIPTCVLTLDYGASGQGFGTYDLRHYGVEMITKIIEAVGASSWEALVGKHCRAKSNHTKVHAIGHIIDDKWYEPETQVKAEPQKTDDHRTGQSGQPA